MKKPPAAPAPAVAPLEAGRGAAAPVPLRKPRAKKGQAEPKPPAYSRSEMKRLLEAILFAADKPVPAAV